MFSRSDYEALHAGAARIRLADRGVLRVTGADRAAWLQGLVTNDVLGLSPGRRRYAAYLTPQGRMVTDLWLVAATGALFLDVPAALAGGLASRLDSLVFAEDVQIDDVSARMACTLLVGVEVPDGAAGEAPGTGVLVADETYGRSSLVAYGDADQVLRARGLPQLCEVRLADPETFEVFRIEAGVPRFLVDMTEDTIPLEAGIADRAISFTKGCYVGQEVIVRVTTRGGGRVARRLVGLTLEGDESSVPSAGAPVHDGDRGVGHVTSAAWSPRLQSVIALGYVHRDFVTPGTPLEVRHGGQQVRAVVNALPFVGPSR